jgi:hypothetical protein
MGTTVASGEPMAKKAPKKAAARVKSGHGDKGDR